jgi:phosphoribosyl-AMP cyclohydrolase
MMGWMDAEALRRTLTEGRVTFWSRSRSEYWRKGDTSGHAQFVRHAALDCDDDVLLVTVEQIGAACHTGAHSCFEVGPLSPVIASSTDGRRDV